MAIIKCSTCGKNVSDEAAKCPNCNNDLSKAVYCPKCGSDDTSVLLKWNSEPKRMFLARLIHALVGHFASYRAYEESEYGSKVCRICNNCGKKFKVK